MICCVEKLQHVHKALAYCRLNVSPYVVHSTVQSYSFRFSVLFLFPEVAQLHNMLKEIILYIRETEFLPLSPRFPSRTYNKAEGRRREEEEAAFVYLNPPQLSLSTVDMKHM